MRVVRNIEPRVVTEQQRRVFDTFIRPTINEDKRMFELADTLNKIAPVIRNYKDEADQARYNKEVAEGYAASANFKPDEVPADRFYRYSSVNANEYAKRSRAFQHGVNIHEAEALANTLPTAADEWFRTQSYNGRRIFEIDDPVQFNEAYRSFIRQYIQGETGGSMDPQIYQKYLQGPISQTEHNVTQQFLSERRKYMENKASSAFTRAMNSSVFTTFRSDAYFDDRDKWKAENIPVFVAQSIALSNTIGDTKAGNVASNLIDSYIADASSENELNDLLAMAKANPLIWDNAENQKQINKAVRYQALAIRQQEQRELTEARRVAKERQYEERQERNDEADDWCAKNPNASFEDFMRDHPEYNEGFGRKLYTRAISPYRQLRREREADVRDLNYSPEETRKMYEKGEISKNAYEDAVKKRDSQIWKYKANIASAIQKKFMPPAESPELNPTIEFTQSAALKFTQEAMEAQGAIALLEAGKTVPPEVTSKIISNVQMRMDQTFPLQDLVKEVVDYRLKSENFSQTDPQRAPERYSAFIKEVRELGRDDINTAAKTGFEYIGDTVISQGSWPTFDVFCNDLETLGVNVKKLQTEIPALKLQSGIDSFEKLFECLVLLNLNKLEGGTTSAGNKPKPSNGRPAGRAADDRPAAGRSTADEEPAADTDTNGGLE